MDSIRTRSKIIIPSTLEAEGLMCYESTGYTQIKMNLSSKELEDSLCNLLGSFPMLEGIIYRHVLTVPILEIKVNELERESPIILRENIKSIELLEKAILVTTDIGMITFDISGWVDICQQAYQYSEELKNEDAEKFKDEIAKIMPSLRAMNYDGAIRLSTYNMECDICSKSGAGSIVRSSEFSGAVRKGFNPFFNGCIPEAMLQMAPPGHAEQWARSATSGDTSHSDWNVCATCMVKLSPYLVSETPKASTTKKSWWRFWK
jgi:hypothetical protein